MEPRDRQQNNQQPLDAVQQAPFDRTPPPPQPLGTTGVSLFIGLNEERNQAPAVASGGDSLCTMLTPLSAPNLQNYPAPIASSSSMTPDQLATSLSTGAMQGNLEAPNRERQSRESSTSPNRVHLTSLSSSSSSSLSGLSANSAPQLGVESSTADLATSTSIAALSLLQQQLKRQQQLQQRRASVAATSKLFSSEGCRRQSSCNNNSDSQHFGCFKVSQQMMGEIRQYKRSLILLAITLIYTLFALATVLVRQHQRTPMTVFQAEVDSANELEGPAGSAWSQDQIAGWHRERKLELSEDELRINPYGQLFVGGCKARESGGAEAAAQQEGQPAVANGPRQNQTNGVRNATTTTGKPRRIKFHALNGCMFRRDATSDSLGDLCCCAGKPRYVTTTTTTTPMPAFNHTVLLTTIAASVANSTETKRPTRRAARKYLRPQLMCFVSSAGSLFNAQRLVAPVADEYNLRNTFGARERNKCIACSCCHEHEPEEVNKLLANVPLSLAKRRKSNAAAAAADETPPAAPTKRKSQTTGLWVSARAHLVNGVRSLDEFAFWLFDMIDLGLFALRYGQYPVDEAAARLISPERLAELHAAPLFHKSETLEQESLEEEPAAKVVTRVAPAELATLSMDADAYDDFKTTTSTTTTSSSTTTSTTTTTTSTTTTHAPTRRRKLHKGKRRRRRTTTTSAPTDKLASSSTASSSIKMQVEANNTTPGSTSTTTKSPTVIINVYAAGAGGTTSTTVQPRAQHNIMLIDANQAGIRTATAATNEANVAAAAKQQRDPKANIELRIEVDNKHQTAHGQLANMRVPPAIVGAKDLANQAGLTVSVNKPTKLDSAQETKTIDLGGGAKPLAISSEPRGPIQKQKSIVISLFEKQAVPTVATQEAQTNTSSLANHTNVLGGLAAAQLPLQVVSLPVQQQQQQANNDVGSSTIIMRDPIMETKKTLTSQTITTTSTRISTNETTGGAQFLASTTQPPNVPMVLLDNLQKLNVHHNITTDFVLPSELAPNKTQVNVLS